MTEKVKVRFVVGDFEEELEYDLDEDWTYTTIDELLETWLYDNADCSVTILEVDGKPFRYE